MSDDQNQNRTPETPHKPGSLPSWWPAEDEPAAPMPEPAPPITPPLAPEAPAAPAPRTNLAEHMPAWWRPEFQTAKDYSPSSAPLPPAPAPVQAAPTVVPPPAAPPTAPVAPMPAPRPPSPASQDTMVLGIVPAAPPVAILTVTAGPDAGFRFRIKADAIAHLGRDTENDVVLNDPATSRRHARIQFKEARYVLTDLGSANGTIVNDQRVLEQALSNGDLIRVGQNTLRISIEG